MLLRNIMKGSVTSGPLGDNPNTKATVTQETHTFQHSKACTWPLNSEKPWMHLGTYEEPRENLSKPCPVWIRFYTYVVHLSLETPLAACSPEPTHPLALSGSSFCMWNSSMEQRQSVWITWPWAGCLPWLSFRLLSLKWGWKSLSYLED